jgi:PQQ-dependent catabolism-associated CXXCW motif protein
VSRPVIARATLALALVLLPAPPAGAAAPPLEPTGYRLDEYHGPTPLTVGGRPAIDTAEARRLWEAHEAVFIDVVAAPRRPGSLPAGSIWSPPPHLDIPGSVWLPDSGRGALSPELDAWFRASLVRISATRSAAPLVFYCRTDCWLSWNATKRALEWGYRAALWYRDGSDGWSEAGLPLAQAQPPSGAPR